jgi:conjugal transfer mating pair stabilization protein TraN
MDLSEYYADVETRAQSDIQVDMKDKIDAIAQTINP